MRTAISAGTLSILLAFLGSPGSALGQGADAKDAVTAKLGGIEVRSSSLLRLIQAQPVETRKALREKPEAMTALARNEVLRKAVVASAKQEGFDKKPDVEIGMQRSAEQALIDRYLDFKTAPEPTFPGQESIEAAYKANQQAFSVPARVHLAQILLTVPVDISKKKSEQFADQAKEVMALAQPPADFGAIAKRYSEDKPSNEKGGDVGWLEVSTLLPEVRDAIGPLAPGGVSKPVRTRFGWQIFKLIERKNAYVRPLAEVSADIVAALRKQKADENKKAWLNALQAGGIVLEEPALAEIRKKIE